MKNQKAPMTDHMNCQGEQRTLHEEVNAQARLFQTWADNFERRRCSRNKERHWRARGSQEILRKAARHLEAMRDQHALPVALYWALQDYLGCLDKYSVDACEPVRGGGNDQGALIERWKVEGQEEVLPRIRAALSRLKTDAHEEGFVLSLDGTELVLVGKEDAEAAASPGPFPALPETLNTYQRAMLTRLELSLSMLHTCTLVQTQPGVDNTVLLMCCLDRLLRYAPADRILLLAGQAHLKPHLKKLYMQWTSQEDGQQLAERYPVQDRPVIPIDLRSPVCIASLREVQLLTQGDQPLPGTTFDAIVIYDLPCRLSAVWQRVLGYLEARYWIGFSEEVSEELAGLFEYYVVSSDATAPTQECVPDDGPHSKLSHEGLPC